MGAAPAKIILRAIMMTVASCALLGALGWLTVAGAGWTQQVAAVALFFCLAIGSYLAWLYLPDVDLPGRSPRRGRPSAPARVALTFDDGPNGADTVAVLDALARHRVRATFFVVGEAVRRHPELVRRMVADGHVVGSHTDRHTKLPWISAAAIERELDDATAAIVAAGAPAPTWFRAPHGWKSPFLPAALRRRGMQLVAWTHGVWDTDRPGADAIAERAISCLADREILLLHDGTLGADRSQTAAALDRILTTAGERGIQLVTVPDILAAGS